MRKGSGKNEKNRIIALLTVIVFGTCIVGCGNEVAPDSNSTNEVEANIEETNSDVPIVTPDVIFGDSFQDYVGERITVVGYPGFYTKFDDSTKDSLKEMGDGYLFITTKSELDWTAPQVFCIFDGDQTDVFTDEILDSFRENGTLIGITGICKERALLADCNPEFKQFDKTEVPFYQTDESSDTETSSITTKTDSTQDPESTTTSKSKVKSQSNSDIPDSVSNYIQELNDFLESHDVQNHFPKGAFPIEFTYVLKQENTDMIMYGYKGFSTFLTLRIYVNKSDNEIRAITASTGMKYHNDELQDEWKDMMCIPFIPVANADSLQDVREIWENGHRKYEPTGDVGYDKVSILIAPEFIGQSGDWVGSINSGLKGTEIWVFPHSD